MGLDIISYGAASKSAPIFKKNKASMSISNDGEDAKGTFSTVKERIDTIQEKVESAYSEANKVIVQNAVNLIKAELKLNIISKMSVHEMNKMVVDDLYDLDGIDLVKSKNYIHDIQAGSITAKQDCVIQLKKLDALKVDSIIFNLDLTGASDRNVALGKPVTGVTKGQLITDGLKTNIDYAYTSSAGQATIDLGQSYNLRDVHVYWYYGDNRIYLKTNLSYSTDNKIWTKIETGDFQTKGVPTPQVVDLNGAEARYIRSYGRGNTINIQTHWLEIEAFEIEEDSLNDYELQYSLDEIAWTKLNKEDITYLKENKGNIHMRILLPEGKSINGYGYVYE